MVEQGANPPTNEASAPSNTIDNNKNNLAPFNPSSETAQRQSIALMNLQPDDILFDLGCGDGRLLIRSASEQPGLRCVGVEINPIFVERALHSVSQLPPNVQERIEIRCQDVTQVLQSTNPDETLSTTISTKTCLNEITVHDATVIYLYLLPRGLLHIKALLDDLVQHRMHKGQSLRIVAYTFSVKGWEPTRVDTSTKSGVPIYLYEFNG